MNETLTGALERYNPVACFALFSGGHDSLVSTHIAMQHPAIQAVVHVNTGIGIEQTRQFVRDICARFGWLLLEYRAEDHGQYYERIVLENGFPGPGQHHKMYARLKERALRALKRDYAPRQNMLLVTGIRRQESVKRMGIARPIQYQGSYIWTAPIVEWSADDCDAYMQQHGLPRNRVKDQLCISGECLCGAFARRGEMAELKAHYPEVHARIKALEARCQQAGVWHRWGSGGPPKWYRQEQAGQQVFMPLCSSCLAEQDS